MRIFFLLILLPFFGSTQSTEKNYEEIDTTFVLQAKEFVRELYEPGLEMTEDSLLLSREFNIMMVDSAYRSMLFPDTYTWLMITQLLKAKRLKHAFWYLINLYPENDTNKELVLNVILTYDQIFEMDKIMTSTFYTYSFFDPRISFMKDGKPEITRPDILEEKLEHVKEIVAYIHAYRKQQEEVAKSE